MVEVGQSDQIKSDMEACLKQRCGVEFLHAEKIAPTDVHECLLNISGDETVDLSTVRWWVVCFSSVNSNVKDKPCSGWPCTAVTPQNEEHLESSSMLTGRLQQGNCTDLNTGFSVLETMVTMLEYHKVCARWIPQMLTQEHHMQVCQEP